MTKWQTAKIVETINKLGYKAIVKPVGGDYDTENIYVPIQEADALYVTGFNASVSPNDKSDCEIEFIEVRDGLDSSGGLNSNSEATGIAYGKICAKLRTMGYLVVPSYEHYF